MLDHLFIHAVSVFRTTRTPDGAGGFETELVPVGIVNGRVSEQPAMGREAAIARTQVGPQQGSASVHYLVYFPVGTDVERNDLLVTDYGTMRAIALSSPSVTDTYLRVDAQETQREGGEPWPES